MTDERELDDGLAAFDQLGREMVETNRLLRAVQSDQTTRNQQEHALSGVVCGRGRNPTLRLWPAIFSGEIDVLPSERRDVGQEIGR